MTFIVYFLVWAVYLKGLIPVFATFKTTETDSWYLETLRSSRWKYNKLIKGCPRNMPPVLKKCYEAILGHNWAACNRGHRGHKRSVCPFCASGCAGELVFLSARSRLPGFVWVYRTSPCHLLQSRMDVSNQLKGTGRALFISVTTDYCSINQGINEWISSF